MDPLLLLVLVVSVVNLLLTSAFIAHEMGWFPHGKYRGPFTLSGLATQVPTAFRGREGGYLERQIAAPHPVALEIRRFVYPDVYDYEDPKGHLEGLLARFKEEPSPGRRADLVNVMNQITAHEVVSDHLNVLAEQIIEEVRAYNMRILEKEDTDNG